MGDVLQRVTMGWFDSAVVIGRRVAALAESIEGICLFFGEQQQQQQQQQGGVEMKPSVSSMLARLFWHSLVLLGLTHASSWPCSRSSHPGPANPGFENGNLDGWHVVSGNAFGGSAVRTNATYGDDPLHNDGNYFVSSAPPESGDKATGQLQSGSFVASADLSFLIGGGYDPDNLYVALVRDGDDKNGDELLKQTGVNDDSLLRIVWDTSEWLGQTVRVVVHDNSTEGHILFDDLRVGCEALGDGEGLTFKRIAQQHQQQRRQLDDDDCSLYAVDALRPQFHYTPYQGWINDPSGLIEWKGRHHLFSQFHQDAPVFGPMSWSHAESTDAVHWRNLPPALVPPPKTDPRDGSGRFTGCAVHGNDDNITLIFTDYTDVAVHPGAVREVVASASSTDGVSFPLNPHNPIIGGPPAGSSPETFRDPKVFRDDEAHDAYPWKMVLGSSSPDAGKVLLYGSSSADLGSWTTLGAVYTGDGSTGATFECPNLFPLQDRWVLLYGGINSTGFWETGTFNGTVFVSDKRGRLDHGTASYAAQWYKDARGRDLVIAWMGNWITTKWATRANGWAGQQSLTRDMFLLPDGSLGFRPVAELDTLAEDGWQHLGPRTLTADNGDIHLAASDTLRVKLSLDLARTTASLVTLSLAQSSAESALVTYEPATRTLSVDTRSAGYAQSGVYSVVVAAAQDGKLHLDIFIDRSSVEVFTGDGLVISAIVWARYQESNNVELRARGGEAAFERISVARLASSWC